MINYWVVAIWFAGLFLECPGTTALSLRSTLERISAPIHSLSIYDFDRSVTSLSQDVIQPGVHIRHLQFSHSHLEALKENSLRNVRGSLESLSIVNGKLSQVSSWKMQLRIRQVVHFNSIGGQRLATYSCLARSDISEKWVKVKLRQTETQRQRQRQRQQTPK